MSNKPKHQFVLTWTDVDGCHSIEVDRIVIQNYNINGWNATNIETFDGTTTRFFYAKEFTIIDNYKE